MVDATETTTAARLFGFEGRVAIVTGGGSGIGEAIATVLAGLGATVVVADVNLAGAERVAADIGGVAQLLDIGSESAIEAAFATMTAAHGAPWLLVNCAGVQDRVLLSEARAADWDRFLAVNVRGTALCLREGARLMIEAGKGGRIVNIASLSAQVPMLFGLGPYAASKGAVISLTQNAALEYAEYGITVNAVLPGGVLTPGGANAKGTPPRGPGVGTGRHPPPLGTCMPEDIAAAVAFLGSLGAGKISAQSLIVDGGYVFS